MPTETENRESLFTNPLKKMLSRKKDSQKEEEGGLLNTQHPEERFIQLLRTVNFSKSRLPQAVLEKKSDPRQSRGDLEYTVGWLLSQLQTYPSPGGFIPGTEELDNKLCRLIRKFKETVDSGYPRAAYTTRDALLKGFRDIRFGLHTMSREDWSSDNIRAYITECVAYLDRWMVLIDYTMMADVAQDNVRKAEASYQKFLDDHEKLLDEFEQEILYDREKLADYYAIANSTDSGHSLTKSQMDLRLRMVEHGVQRVTGKLKEVTWRRLAEQQTLLIGKIEVLRTDVIQSPLPNVGGHFYTMAVQDMLERVATMDKEIEESVLHFAELSGQIDAMEHMAGAEAAKNYAARSVATLAKQAVTYQNQNTALENNQ